MDGIVFFDDLVPTYRFTGGVRISKQNFIKEHVKLIDILTHGSPKERAREAADQSQELSGVMKGSGNACTGGPGASVRPANCPPPLPPELTILKMGALLYKRWGKPGEVRHDPTAFKEDEDYIYDFGRRHGVREFLIDDFIRRGRDEFFAGRYGSPILPVYRRDGRGRELINPSAFSIY
jgi:hypothetical protein